MIEVFHMSDEEGFADSSTYSVASNVKKDSSFNNSSSSMELVNMNTVSCGLTNERKQRVRRRHRPPSFSTCFTDYYAFTDEVLGMGAQGVVCTCVHKLTNVEYAVKLINKQLHPDRQRVFKEMDIFYTCRNCEYILKLHEYFEDDTYFYLLFDKMHGGQLLHHILKRGHLNEREASMVTRQIAEALQFMHRKGLAHRDLKPENILCQSDTELLPIKLCDFDLASAIRHAGISTMTTPALSTPVGSAEFMAPEVVDAWVVERDKGDFVNYDKRCDLWSLGVIIYIMLCGYPPFYGHCEESKCGWEDGGYCRECQQLLFNRIRDGEFSFPSPEWDCISDDAKDLIGHLLVCDSRLRYSADQVLLHRWIKYPAPETALTTAKVLLRDNSVRNLETFTNEALSISKLIDVQLATNNHQKNLTEMSDNRGDITRCRFVISNNEYLDNNIANKNCSKVVIPKGFACLSRTQQPSHQLCRSSCISNKPLIESPVNGTKYARCNGSNTVDSDILSVNCSRHAVSKENENSIVSDANTEDYNWNCMESVLVECMKSILLDKQNKKYLKRQHQLSKGDCHRRNQLCYSSSIAFSSSRSSCGFEYMKELHRNTTTADDQPFGNRNQIALYHSAKQPPYDSRSDQLIFNQDHRRLS